MNRSPKSVNSPVNRRPSPTGLLSDVVLWLVFLYILGWGVWYFGFQQPENNRQVIALKFNDANELSRGAIVRMMGVEIGHVSRIQLKQDHVDVVIKTRPGVPKIPSGSTFTILFTGLVGSKSIEIEPPKIPQPYRRGEPVYYAEDPIRMKQTMQYQIDVARALQRGAENFADFFGKKKSVAELQFNIQQAKTVTAEASRKLVRVNNKMVGAQGEFAQGMNNVADTMVNFAGTAQEAAYLLQPGAVMEPVHYFQMTVMESYAALMGFHAERKFLRFNEKAIGLSGHLIHYRQAEPMDQVSGTLVTAENRLGVFHATMGRVEAFFQGEPLPVLRDWRQAIQGWNTRLEALNKKLDEKL